MLRLYRHAANVYTLRLRYSKRGSKKCAICVSTLLQNELNSHVARFRTHFRTCLATNKVARFVFEGGKKRATALYNSFCSHVAEQVARFLLPVLPHLNSIDNHGPLALRGHVTNAFFKQWVGILLIPKTDRAHKNYLTPEIWEETHLREIFYGTLIFQQSSMICVGRHVGGHTRAIQHNGQNYFLLISC